MKSLTRKTTRIAWITVALGSAFIFYACITHLGVASPVGCG